MRANRAARRFVEPSHRLLQYAIANGGRADDQRAIRDGLGNGLELIRLREQVRGAHCGLRLAEAGVVDVDQAKAVSAEIAHGPGGGADVERIARAHQHYDETIQFGEDRQGVILR